MRQFLPVLLLATLPAWAQQGNPPLLPVPPPPPDMEAVEAALEPQVTIVTTDTETREEFRQNGWRYMGKVTPAIGPEYYLVDHQRDGNFVQQAGPGPGAAVVPAMWRIFSW